MASVLFVGDTHANVDWLRQVVLPTAKERGVEAIVQVGDFGYWPDRTDFLDTARLAQKRFGVDFWFLDGNHENFAALEADVAAARLKLGLHEHSRDPVALSDGFGYLPRGARFDVSGHSVAVCGGAASVDRRTRTMDVGWFLQERVTDDDITAVAAGGHAEVLVCHDTPSRWVVPGMVPLADMAISWIPELPSCDEHRARMREVLAAVQPSLYIHGHYHSGYYRQVVEEWGVVEVVGLDCDGTSAWGVLMHDVGGELVIEGVRGAR